MQMVSLYCVILPGLHRKFIQSRSVLVAPGGFCCYWISSLTVIVRSLKI